GDEGVRRHGDVRRVVAVVEKARNLRQIAVQGRLSAGQDDRVERREIGEGTVVLVEAHFQVAVDVQVIPVEARHALGVAEVRHPEDQIPRQGFSAPQPVGGERGALHVSLRVGAAWGRAGRRTAAAPRTIPAMSPAKYTAWWSAKAKGTAGNRSGSRRQIG